MTDADLAWLRSLEDHVPAYLRTLRIGEQAGRYLPCRRGATEVGRQMGLGFSCFALKTLHILGKWDTLSREEREAWIEFLQDYQQTNGECAFEDPPQMAALREAPNFFTRLKRLVGRGPATVHPRDTLLAETKQAIATLAEVGAAPSRPFRGFPTEPEKVRAFFESKDWSRPWGAGGQSAGLVVFLVTQAPAFAAPDAMQAALAVCRDFYASLADPATGAYFRGSVPAHGEMINGAMKVLMALDWLGVPVHYPQALIATTLAHEPEPSGCHLVDAIYVLHRCLAGRPASEAVRRYCSRVLQLIRSHANEDGGFSFHIRRAQTHYYGATISRGVEESDIQGTCLLTWALAMIRDLLAPGTHGWKLLRP